MAALGVSLAGVLALAHRRLTVFEDPRIDQVKELLPRNIRGACREPGRTANWMKRVGERP